MAVAVISSGAYFAASGTYAEVINAIGARKVQQNQIINISATATDNCVVMWRSGQTRGI